MTAMRKVHRFGFVRERMGHHSPRYAPTDYSRRVTHVTACGQLTGTYYPVKAVHDEHFVYLDRDRRCWTCDTQAWPRGRRVTTHAEREEFVTAIEMWMVTLAQLGDERRVLGHGRCHHDLTYASGKERECPCGRWSLLDRRRHALELLDYAYGDDAMAWSCAWAEVMPLAEGFAWGSP